MGIKQLIETGRSTCNLRGLWLPLARSSNESSHEFDRYTEGRQSSQEAISRAGGQSWRGARGPGSFCGPQTDGEILWVSPSTSLAEVFHTVGHLSVISCGTERKAHSWGWLQALLDPGTPLRLSDLLPSSYCDLYVTVNKRLS